MEDNKKTIEEMYNTHVITDAEYPLEIWHNEVIKKTPDELILSDISRMIRQKVFLDMAIPKAIAILKEDPFVGDMFTGQLLENLLGLDPDYYLDYKAELNYVVKEAEKNANDYPWGYPEEKDEYLELVKTLKKILK